MAKLKQALPTVIGQPQSAQRSVHPVRMPDRYAGLADGIGEMFNGGVRLAGAVSDILDERNELDYRRTFNDAIAEVDARLQKEVYEKTGIGAEGAVERTSAIYGEVFGKYSGKLSGRNKQHFEEAWGTRRNGQMPSVMQFEYKQLTGAKLDLNKQTINGGIAHYASTGAATDLVPVVDAFNSTYRIQNGGRLITGESLSRFDADVSDGDGFVTLPDGKKLRIGTDISKEDIAAIRGKMAAAAEHYEAGKQQLLDTAHVAIVNRYIEAGDYESARSHLGGSSVPISPGARDALISKIDRHAAVSDDHDFVQGAAQRLASALVSADSTYDLSGQERTYNGLREEIGDSTLPPERKRRRLGLLEKQYAGLLEKQRRALSDSAAAAVEGFERGNLSPVQQAEVIARMPDSPVKDAMQKALDRRVKSVTSPELRRRVAMIAGGVADGKTIELDGIPYDTSNPRHLRALAFSFGLPGEKETELLEALTDVPVTLAATTLADLLGVDLKDADRCSVAMERYPTLITDLKLLGATRGTKPGEIKQMVTTLLTQEVNNSNLLGDTSDDLRDYLDNGFGNDELYFSYPQMRRALMEFDRKSGRRPSARENDYSYQQIMDFARARGYVPLRQGGETVWYLQPREEEDVVDAGK